MQLALEKLQRQFGDKILSTSQAYGDETAVVAKDSIVEIVQFLRDSKELQFNMMMDLCGVHYPDRQKPFEVVYHFYSTKTRKRIRIKVTTDDKGEVPSISRLYKAANWFEREAFDLFGIRFSGHPNLKRILLFEEFEGHPLRKDYPVNRRPKIPTPDSLMK